MAQDTKSIGQSVVAKRMSKLAGRLASGKEDVVIWGEAGSGRRTIALEIHNARGKKKQPVLINGRTAFDEEVRASLTGQSPDVAESLTGRKQSIVQDQSTLIVADLEFLAPHNQDLVLKFLRDGRKKYSGVKIIITLQHSLDQLAQSGAILGDLLPLLEKCEVMEIPALRDRAEDIPALAQSIVRRLCSNLGIPPKKVEPNISHILSQGQWLGNIQELVAVLGKAVLTSSGEALELPGDFLDEHQHLEDAITNIANAKPFVLDQSLDLIEKLLIQRALKQFQYNQSRTAGIFGLSEANFRYRLKKFGLPSIRKKA